MEADPPLSAEHMVPERTVLPVPEGESKRRLPDNQHASEQLDVKRFRLDTGQTVEAGNAGPKKPGLKGKFGKKAWLQEFTQQEQQPQAASGAFIATCSLGSLAWQQWPWSQQ